MDKINTADPLVSVIVPVYKVEKYLDTCVGSILNQTYKNLEIVLVDDGSPDRCGELCDEYAKKDERVKVIHKENGGLSDARNVGIAQSKGEYIALIDSDDFVSPCFVEILLIAAQKYNAKVVCSGSSVQFFDEEQSSVQFKLGRAPGDFLIKPVITREALEGMFYKKYPTGAPFNFYRREIFDTIRYPIGRLYEDFATTYKTYIAAKDKMCRVEGGLYAYRMRKDSIMRQSFNEKMLDSIPVARQVYKDVCAYDSSLKDTVSQRCFDANFYVFMQVPSDDKDSQSSLWNEIIKYRKSVLADKNPMVRRKNKFAAILSYSGMSMTHRIMQIVSKYRRR